MKYEWVIGKYEGVGASKIVELAHSNVGYYLLEEGGRGGTKEAIVAFKRPIDGPTPEHLEVIDEPKTIQKYERLACLRMGIHRSSATEACEQCGV